MDQRVLERMVRDFLAEDVGSGDVTTAATVPAGTRARARITQKQDGVISGLDAAAATFHATDPEATVTRLTDEGVHRTAPAPVLEVTGCARGILEAERTALNLLGRLSGVATLTARYAAAVEGTGAKVLDTRKTTPGLRLLEKQAVAHGGGHNHRIGLYDMVLIKENHIAAAGGITQAITAARAHAPDLPLECEVRDLTELDEALEAGAPRVLLDNMSPDQLREAVTRTAGRAETEASGGVTLESVREIAQTGVTYVSVGALTHSAAALDLSLILERLP
jgi:nicotinate-nucleotide pyrophosphorylase (carboxylating)